MPWGPDDWDAWTLNGPDEDLSAPVETTVVAELLRRIPGRRTMTVADLGCGRGDWLPFLAMHFGHVVAVDYAPATLAVARRAHGDRGVIFRRRDLRDLKPFKGTLHVALLLESLAGPRVADVDRVLAEVHDCLVEGGLMIATVPAAAKRGRPLPMRLAGELDRPSPIRFTEVDFQYRLRRAGFQGIRIRRIDGVGTWLGTLLGLASRRANN